MSTTFSWDVMDNITWVTIPINMTGYYFVKWKTKRITNSVLNKTFTKTSIWMLK